MVGAARAAATEILSLPSLKQRAKFNLEVGLLRLRLQRLGFSSMQVAVEVSAFRLTIECEMRRQIVRQVLRDSQDGAA
ncbi:MAG: hypothetical protein E5Y01_31815 [Mesorhizobium sp.]|nr:MAG: hypothetical protein EOR75_31960 [Mesorhizobium sp.]TJV47693.1 MAG: hypothetical protein E5Y01_31815 [Mesorhizobium sp.]